MEVIFEEARARLGVEIQRPRNDLAIARTTPAIFGLFSLVTLTADRLIKGEVKLVRTAAWYAKGQPTFSDAIAIVRRFLWGSYHFSTSDLFGVSSLTTKPFSHDFSDTFVTSLTLCRSAGNNLFNFSPGQAVEAYEA